MLTIGVVVALDQTEYISACLEAIYRSTVVLKGHANVIIVDNNSNGPVTNRIHQFFQKHKEITRIITNRSNKGYAFACNQILEATTTDFVCFPHSDTIVSSVALENLISVFVEPDIGVAMPLTCYADEPVACIGLLKSQFVKIKPNNKDFFSARSIAATFAQLYRGSLDAHAKNIAATHRDHPFQYVNEISSFCLAFRTEVLKRVGGFNITFPLRGYEDKELADRLRTKTKFVVCKAAYVHHHGNMTTDGTGYSYPQVRVRGKDIYDKIKAGKVKEATKTTNRLSVINTRPVIAQVPTVAATAKPRGEIDTGVEYKESAPTTVISKPSKIVHVANLSLFANSPRLRSAQNLFLASVKSALTPNVKLIAGVRETCEFSRFTTVQLQRDAITALGDTKNLAFLKDLLDIAAEHAGSTDWLVYTNSDCVLSPTFYQTLERYNTSPFVEYLRLDVQNTPSTLKQVYSYPNKIFDIGIDGFAIRKSYYLETKSLIPDFVIGQPHWDTYVSVLYRTLLPPAQNCNDLYHPIHEQAWDFDKLSPSGKHNVEIFDAAVNAGKIPRNKFVERIPTDPDTAVIIAWFGRDQARIKATVEAISNSYDSQTLTAQFVFVELITDEGETSFPEFANHERIKHITIRGNTTNNGLFQKEALFNIGAQHASKYDYFIFLDSDIYCTQSNWLADIRAHLILNTEKVVQGFEVCVDSIDPQYAFAAWAYGFKNNCTSKLPFNPGICWGMTKAKFYELRGFNPYAIFGCGDGLFAIELGGDRAAEDFAYVYTVKQFNNVVRKIDVHVAIDYTHHHLTHVHHGSVTTRKYLQYQTASMFFSRPITDLVTLDSQKLLAWTDSHCLEQHFMSYFPKIGPLTDFHTMQEQIALSVADTAVIIATYGKDRAELVKQCIEQYRKQTLKVQIIIVELMFDEAPSNFNYQSPLITVHTIRGNDSNRFLCQKEAMYNIGASLVAETIQYLIFLDGDVYSLQPDWFVRIRDKMVVNPDHVVQGFESVIDTIDPQYQFRSLVCNKEKRGIFSKTNPGICWALTKNKFTQFSGFNPYFVEYSGDSGFATEIFNTPTFLYEHYVLEFPCFVEIVRDVPVKGIPTYVDDELIHLHHGYFRDRSYNARKYIVSRWNKPIKEIVELDNNRLVAWRDITSVEHNSLMNIPPHDDFIEVDQFYALANYECRQDSQRKFLGDQKIVSYDHQTVLAYTQDASITLFAPKPETIGDHVEVEHSWSDNFVTLNDSVRLSINQHELGNEIAAVELVPKDRTRAGLCLFPLKRSWAGATIIDASSKKLGFDIKTEGGTEFQVTVYFEGKTETKDTRSIIIPIPTKSYPHWERISIPLKQFITDEFNFSGTRICLFSVTAPTDTIVYLSNIKIQKLDD